MMNIQRSLIFNAILTIVLVATLSSVAFYSLHSIDGVFAKNVMQANESANQFKEIKSNFSMAIEDIRHDLKQIELEIIELNNASKNISIMKEKLKNSAGVIRNLSEKSEEVYESTTDESASIALEDIANDLLDLEDSMQRELVAAGEQTDSKLQETLGQLEQQYQGLVAIKAELENTSLEIDKKVQADEQLIIEAETVKNNMRGYKAALFITMLIIFAASLTAGVWIYRRIVQPLNTANEGIIKIGNDILDDDINYSRFPNTEVKTLLAQIENMRKILLHNKNELINSVQDLTSTADELNDMSCKNKEINDNQFTKADLISTAVEQMSVSIREININTNDAATSATDAARLANTGGTVINRSVRSMSELTSNVEHTAEIIQDVAESANEINTVLDVIKAIAEQTNLLALNAAIEAARAGEQGRGFAVVADEVRALAGKTQESTDEIQAIITTLNERTEQAVSAIQNKKDIVEKVSSSSEDVDRSFMDIKKSVNDVEKQTTQIATALEEQTTVSQDISNNVLELRGFTQESSSYAANLSAQIDALRKVSRGLDSLTRINQQNDSAT